MTIRCNFENSSQIGVFVRLTNTYCIIGAGACENSYSAFKQELSENIPIVKTFVAGTRLVGRMCVGNANGILLPNNMTDQEVQHVRNCLPDKVVVQRLDERLSALGNIIACNDYTALLHPEIQRETEEIVIDVLRVETFRESIAGQPLVGSYSCLSNIGGIVHPRISLDDLDDLSSLIQIPLTPGTVNRGSEVIASGLVVNDWTAFSGLDTTSTELLVLESIFKLRVAKDENTKLEINKQFIDSII